MMNMKILSVVTPLSIYHGWSTQKMFWEKKLTGEKNLTLGKFKAVNMIFFGCRNVIKHIEIKVSDKYITLEILLKFGNPDKIRIIS